jgi:cytochrome c553
MKIQPFTALLVTTVAMTGLALTAPVLGQSNRRDPERIYEGFKRKFDKDLDGRVSKAEFTGRKNAWKRFDVDGDGFITLADLKARAKEAEGEKEAEPRAAEPSMATADQIKFFETKVRPVLANECFSCHASSGRSKGGLALDTLGGFLSGGASGPALIPGDAEASAFIEAIRYDDPGFSMPPKNKLKAHEIADLEAWVRMGAPWPDEEPPEMIEMAPSSGSVAMEGDDSSSSVSLNRDIDIEAGKEFWSFRPVMAPEVPDHAEDTWSQGAIDRFILAGMQAGGVEPVGDAADRTWLRRVTIDLTGLPPTLDEIAAFDADTSAERDTHVVDRLLASDAYAERWGRHWLDVARFAESSGKERNVVYSFAWRYRDWVLDAFRQDMPYNEFIEKQIAGDLLPAADVDEEAQNQIATGYLALGPKSHANRDRIGFQLDLVDEQIDAMSQGMLGLTLSCARCHDHKFDPIPTEDYYGLAGIFMSTETHFGTTDSRGNNRTSELIELPPGADVPNGPTMGPGLVKLMERAVDKLDSQASADEAEMEGAQMDGLKMDDPDEANEARLRRLREAQQGVYEGIFERFDENGRATEANRMAMGASEGEPRDISVLERGELDRPSGVTPRAIPQVFRQGDAEPISEGSGRAELAAWLSSDDNPLTARVWANRVWLHMFGAGIVTTPDNFGAGGQAPTHPELLDWLASRLMEGGWSTKGLIREIALSRAYRLDSAGDRSNEKVDPDVTLLWRMPERRMESEVIRDAMLSVAGTLSLEPGVGSPLGAFEGLLRGEQVNKILLAERPVRSVYLPAPRGMVMGTLEAFDAPDSEFVTGQRDETTVATQALFLMNDGEVLRMADAFADRLLGMDGHDRDRIEAAFELAYGRDPSTKERRVVELFLRDYAQMTVSELRADGQQPEPDVDDKELSARDRRRLERAARRKARQARRDAEVRGNAPAKIEDPRRAAWSAFAQSLFQSAEFRAIG